MLQPSIYEFLLALLLKASIYDKADKKILFIKIKNSQDTREYIAFWREKKCQFLIETNH